MLFDGFKVDHNKDLILSYRLRDFNERYQVGFLKVKNNGIIDGSFLQNGIFRPTIADTARTNFKTIIDDHNNYIFLLSDQQVRHGGFGIFKCDAQGIPQVEFGNNGFLYINPATTEMEEFINLEYLNDSTFYTVGFTYSEIKAFNLDLTIRKYVRNNVLLSNKVNEFDIECSAFFDDQNLIIDMNTIKESLVSMKLYGADGKLVRNFGNQEILTGDNRIQLKSGSNLPASSYFLNLQNKEGQKTIKLMKH